MEASVYVHSDRGRQEINEDSAAGRVISGSGSSSFFGRLFGDSAQDAALAVVADGLGGHGSGDIASGIARDTAEEGFLKCAGDGSRPGSISKETILSWVEEANRRILERQKQDHSKMRTTFAAVVVNGKKAFLANTGDTRIYHFRKGRFHSVTADHSVSYASYRSGAITYDDIRFDEDQNRLLRVLGNEERFMPDIKEISVEKGDLFLLCSDGAWKHFTNALLEELLAGKQNAEECGDTLRHYIDEHLDQDNDNYTIAVIKIR